MNRYLPPIDLQVALTFLGFLAAWPIFLFVGGGDGLRFSMSAIPWRECWLGLQSWTGIPVPLIFPVLVGACLFADPWRSLFGLVGASAFAALLISAAGISRGLQLIIPLVWLASVPRWNSSSWMPSLLRGWWIGALCFVLLQLSGVWFSTGSLLMRARASQVAGAAGDWGVAESTRMWGLCVYQALISVPDLLMYLATFLALKTLSTILAHSRYGLIWGTAWMVTLIAAFNSGRSSVILILLFQWVVAFSLIFVGRCSRLLMLVPSLPLLVLLMYWVASLKPVVLDRFLYKIGSNQLMDRLPIWGNVSEALIQSPKILMQGTAESPPGTHSLIGDLVVKVGLPLALVYILFVMALGCVAWSSLVAKSSAWAKAGLGLLLIVPLVQNLINANLLQPYSFGSFLLAALAIVSFV